MKRWNAAIRQTGPNNRSRQTADSECALHWQPLPLIPTALDPVRLTGFTLPELSLAFERVRNPFDWQGPIFAEIPASERRVVDRALYWFTATLPVFAAVPGDPTRLIVTAVGFRLGPAGR